MPDIAGSSATGGTLILFTESYPYDRAMEDNFLAPELPLLRTYFDRVVVAPSQREGLRASPPEGVEVDESFARALQRSSNRLRLVADGVTSRLFWQDIAERPGLLTKPRAIRLLLRTAAKAELTRRWMRTFWRRHDVQPRQSVAYSFWCDHSTVGLALLKRDFPELIVVSRAHGADLYAERHRPSYLPCRTFTLSQLDRLFPDSDRGVRYVAERYPWFAERCEISRLGVLDSGFVTTRSQSGSFSIVSCSTMVAVKRIDLIVDGLAQAARLRPDLEFFWHHFGDGELRRDIEEQAASVLPPNVHASMPGYPGRSSLMEFYRSHPVDAFMNTSSSEGTPVAVMEAISCGIPVIATSVGGNPEIVSSENGWLLNEDPSAVEIAEAIVSAADDSAVVNSKGEGSLRIWKAKYNALASYETFARRLIELRDSR